MTTANQIKLSIVVPFYNTAAYLPRCLDSLLSQTLPEIEIICVNDGSPDGCLNLLKQYEKANPEVVRIVNKDNGGLWAARWTGTDLARGEYVAYVDSDDYVATTFAEDLYQTAKTKDADIVICGFKRIEEETGNTLSTELSEPRTPFVARQEPGRLIEINPAAWNKAFRRDLLMKMHRLENPPVILEDVTLSQLAYLASSKAICFTGTAPYNYIIRSGSMINSVTQAQVDSVKRALLEVAKYYELENVEDGFRESLDAAVFLHLGVSMSFRLSCNNDVDLKSEIKATTSYLDTNFPTWRDSPYINLNYALSHGPAFKKLFLSQLFYKAKLMRPFLAAYRFFLEHSGTDIKW